MRQDLLDDSKLNILQWRQCSIRLNVGTLCTGSGSDKFPFDAAAEALQDKYAPIQIEFNHVWVADIVDEKRKWLKEVYAEDGTCIFGSIAEVNEGCAHCYMHDRACAVKHADIILFGFSCKDLSRQSNQFENSSALLSWGLSQENSAQSSTCQTFFGGLKVVKAHILFYKCYLLFNIIQCYGVPLQSAEAMLVYALSESMHHYRAGE